ncbi:MFS-type transporter efuF [Candida tropicalis]
MSSEKPTTSHLESYDFNKPSTQYEEDVKPKTSDAEYGLGVEEINELEYYDLPESLQHMTQEELKALDKKTTRKIDFRILPILIVLYILNYIDRTGIATARLGTLEEDLNLTGSDYQIALSILFAGYILFQVPSNMLMNKLGRPSTYLAVVMTIWGAISTCTAAVQGFGGLAAVRVLLGVVESAFFPGALMILSSWYDKKSLALRNSILYSGSLISSAFGGLISAAILQMDGLGGVSGWRYIFIIEGGCTVLVAPLAYFILPDNPDNTKFLTQEEKDIVMWKLKKDLGNVNDSDKEAKESEWQGFLHAIKDIKVWLLVATHSLLVAACGITNFFPSVVQTLNFSRTITLCLTAPPYVIAVVATFLWSMHADRTGERFWHITVPLLLSLAAFIIAAASLNLGARYFSMCLMIPSLYCAFVVILTWISNCCPRPPAKRAAAIALVNCLSNSTSIWNAYLYPSSDAPRYLIAFCCNCGFIVASIAFAIGLRIRLMVLNKRIERGTINWQKEFGQGNDGSKISADFRFLY